MSLTNPSRARLLKNVGVLSAGCCILFTSYDGLASLQSTINAEHNVGMTSQAVLYFCFSLSALVLPKLVIKRLGVKVTMVLSMLTYVPYVASNFYPQFTVMIPTSVLIGLGASLYWGTQNSYLNDVSRLYAELILVSSSENKSGDDQPPSEENVIFHRSVKSRGGYGSFSNEEDHEAEEKVKNNSGFQTNENDATTNERNLIIQTKNQNEGIRSRTSSFVKGVKEIVEFRGRSNTFPQRTKNTNVGKCDTTINLEEEDHSTDSQYSDKEQFVKPEEKSKKDNSRAVPFDNSGFDSGNEVEIQSKHSFPALHSVKTTIPKCFDSIQFQNNENKSDKKPIISKTEVLQNRKKTISSITARFFGIHGMCFLTSIIWSNLLSYCVMKGHTESNISNFTTSCACGAAFCDQNCKTEIHSFTHMADETRYLLTGICVGLGLFSIFLVALFLDPLDDEAPTKDDASSLNLLLATWDIAKTPDLLMLTPISMYVGMVQAFFQAEYTKAYVGCAWGAGNVGLVYTLNGCACALGSCAAGFAVRSVGRAAVFTFSALLNAASCVMLLTWEPTGNDATSFFVTAVMCGLYIGIIFSQLRALFGVLFKADEEAAFATFNTWYSLGHFCTYAFAGVFCTALKIWALLVVSTVGFVGYLLIEKKYASFVGTDSRTRPSRQNMQVSIIVTPSSPDLGVAVRQRTSSAGRSREVDHLQ